MRWCGVLQPDAEIRSVRARSIQSEPLARASVDWVKNPTLLPLWEKLSSIARRYENVLDVCRDDPGYYKLVKMKTRKSFDPFLAICIQQNHVSLYLTPLYLHPHLTAGMPAVLRSRKTGKCTLRFSDEEDVAIEHVSQLLDECVLTWLDAGMIR